MQQSLNKEISKQLRLIANKLPVVFYQVKETKPWKGSDLLLTALEHDTHGNALDPDNIYMLDEPVMIAINHNRRLKKAYQSGGLGGVKAYLARINKISEQNN